MKHFDDLDETYWKFIRADPTRTLHYRVILQKLYGATMDTRRKILDVGCGDGRLDRLLAFDAYRAEVTGFDSAPNLIDRARKEEQMHPLGITYHVARADEFRSEQQFDDAVSVMVLPYAPDATYLVEFFRSAHRSLLAGKNFSSIVFNPDFQAFDVVIGNRQFTKIGRSEVRVSFLDPNTKQTAFTSQLHQFSKEEYQSAAMGTGFQSVGWEAVLPTKLDEQTDPDFWKIYTHTQPYALLSAQK